MAYVHLAIHKIFDQWCSANIHIAQNKKSTLISQIALPRFAALALSIIAGVYVKKHCKHKKPPEAQFYTAGPYNYLAVLEHLFSSEHRS
jgi:hypothetical protein